MKIKENFKKIKKEDVIEVTSWIVSFPVTVIADEKIENLLQPNTMLEKVGTAFVKLTADAVIKTVTKKGVVTVDKIGTKIKTKISEKKGIHLAEYEVVEG